MDWISAAAAGVCGGLATLAAAGLVRDRKKHQAAFSGVSIALFIAFYGISHYWITPRLNGMYVARGIEPELLKLSAWQALKTHDRATYEQMLARIKTRAQEGRSAAEISADSRVQIAALVAQRLPRAGDQAALDYMRTNIDEVKELMAAPDDYCYRFLFPGQDTPVNFVPRLSRDTIARDLDGLAAVITTSSTHPQTVPTQDEVQQTLVELFTPLNQKYGAELEQISQPQATTDARRKVCTMSVEIYETLLVMPAAQAGPALRYMISLGG